MFFNVPHELGIEMAAFFDVDLITLTIFRVLFNPLTDDVLHQMLPFRVLVVEPPFFLMRSVLPGLLLGILEAKFAHVLIPLDLCHAFKFVDLLLAILAVIVQVELPHQPDDFVELRLIAGSL